MCSVAIFHPFSCNDKIAASHREKHQNDRLRAYTHSITFIQLLTLMDNKNGFAESEFLNFSFLLSQIKSHANYYQGKAFD